VPAPANTETRWVFFQPPTIKTFRHTCAVCGYSTTAATTRTGGMVRHKGPSGWCDGSGRTPGDSELLSETPDPLFEQRMEYKRQVSRFEDGALERMREDRAKAAAAEAARVYHNAAGDIVYRQPDGSFRSDRDARGVPLSLWSID
jgi:hypothetical protein